MRLCTEENLGKRSHIKERLSQLGAKLDKHVCLHPTDRDDSLLILNSYKVKLELLNKGGYRPLKHNHLFVLSDILAEEKMLQTALTEFERASANYKSSFERIIVAVPGYVYEFDLIYRSYCVVRLPSSVQRDFAMIARSNVLHAELSTQPNNHLSATVSHLSFSSFYT